MKPIDPREKDPRELEAEIAETRDAISARLNAIGEKLSPEHIKEEAKDLIEEAKEAAVDKLREVKDSAFETVNETVQEVGDRARRAGAATYGYARSNAIPLGLIGLGVGLLIMGSNRRRRGPDFAAEWHEPEPLVGHRLDVDQPAAGARKLRSLADDAESRAKELSQRAQRGIQQGAKRARRELGPGVAIGLLLPSTRREDELLGPTRDNLLDEVRGSVEQVSRQAKSTAGDVLSALR